MFKKACLAAVLVTSLSITGGIRADNVDLTGVWHTVGGVTFYVRQSGNEIWWFGEQAAVNPRWTNVASGTIEGDQIRVRWMDVPMGGTRNQGRLGLRVVSADHLVVDENPDNFWNAEWTR